MYTLLFENESKVTKSYKYYIRVADHTSIVALIVK